MRRIALGLVLAGALPGAALFAEGQVKTLPTLLIKGEVVSVDTSDPAAILLKVKDRYGFETPIYLQQETKIAQGEATLTPSNLSTGTPVEVEYNFDVNTAKRHAVMVKVTPAAAADAPTAAPAAIVPPEVPQTAPEAVIAPEAMTAPAEAPAAPAEIPADAIPAPQEAAPAAE
jgi:hypothetical protein